MKTVFRVLVIFCLVSFATSQYDCITPNGEGAQCVSIYKCKIFLDALRNRTSEVEMFLKKSQCGYTEGPLVCCGSVARYLLPQLSSCGLQYTDYLPYGNLAKFEEFPWNALLEYKKAGKSVGHKCGGVLINERYVLTAAHCLTGRMTVNVGTAFRVRLGEYNKGTVRDCIFFASDKYCLDTQDIDVAEVIVHSGYNESDRSHDIALLRLTKSASLKDVVAPICLANQDRIISLEDHDRNISSKERLFASGWGHTEKGNFSTIKMRAEVSVVPNKKCAQLTNVPISKAQLCVASATGRESCIADSGGPLVSSLKIYDNHFAEGILSIKPECGSVGIPSIYTRPHYYIDWILNNIKP